jgi:hypothetical protein
MNRLESLFRFIWDFVIGDDWRIAAGVILALAATSLIADTSVAAWWVLPLAVGASLGFSIWQAARARG